jgi:hypothetical protein
MRRLLAAALAVALSGPTVLAAPPPILPFREVRAGMKGIGFTTFRGTEVETFEVEIIGTIPNIAPDQNLILGRLRGGPLETTGVLAGMSGSPVLVEGKLVGAVAYSWGFAKEAIAGITPIEEMLQVAERGSAPPRPRPRLDWNPEGLRALRDPGRLERFFSDHVLGSLGLGTGAPLRAALPMSVAGVGPEVLERVAPALRRAGLLPFQGGGSGSASPGRPALPGLVPGSPVGIKLVRGDVDLTATGTVTWVDGDRVLAFGHPLFGLGQVDLPLATARAEALLPSLEQSARIAVPGPEVGAFRQDRAGGVFGIVGAQARMIPVRVRLSDGSKTDRSFSFDVAEDPLLGPIFLYVSLLGILERVERVLGSLTLQVKEGSVVKLAGQDDAELHNVFAGPGASLFSTLRTVQILYLLMNNPWSTPQVEGVNLLLGFEDEPRKAQLRRVTLDRYRVRPGETVTATVVLRPYRGADLVLRSEIEIPQELPEGRLHLFVGDALAVDRADLSDDPIAPRDLKQLIWLINHLRRNDRVYILALREDSGVLLGGARLPNLPPSVHGILARPQSLGNFAMIPRRGVLEKEIPTGYAVEGFARVQLQVEAP